MPKLKQINEISQSKNIKKSVMSLLLVLSSTTSAYAATYLYDMPFKGQDLPENTKIYRGKAIHGTGIQMYGYDLGAMRYSNVQNKWTGLTVHDTLYELNVRNDLHTIYNKPVYAMRGGKVIGCWRNAPENAYPGDFHWAVPTSSGSRQMPGGGNLLFVKHTDNTIALYAHLKPGTVPESLCPHNAELFPRTTKNEWDYIDVPSAQQATVSKGELIGRVGNAGSSSGPHLHVHLEKQGRAEKLNFRRGIAAAVNNNNPYGNWKSFASKSIPPGPTLIWPARTITAEYTRHGYGIAGYQALFTHLADSGMKPYWLDGYNVNGKVFLNMSWKPSSGKWRAYHGQTSAGYQRSVNKATQNGYVPMFVDSYQTKNGVRYNAIFEKSKLGWLAGHGLNWRQHKAIMNKAKRKGMSPTIISVVSLGKSRSYTTLYHKRSIGSWRNRVGMTSAVYQRKVSSEAARGRTPQYVNSYMHKSKVNYTAIFAKKPTTSWVARHGLTGGGFQTNWSNWVGKGFKTTVVTGIDGYTKHRFAGVWRK